MKQFHFKDIQELESLMGVRQDFNDLEKEYFFKAQSHIKNIKYIPGLRLIAVGNSVAMKSSHEKSDIDLFVVTQKNRLWLVRICMTLYFFAIGLRKTQSKHTGAFCLSFFVDTDALDFREITIKDDIYLFYWILTLKPILDHNNTYKKFIDSNTWANFDDFSEYLDESNIYTSIAEEKKESNSHFYNCINIIIKKIFIGKTLRSYQKLGKPFGVVIHDNMLKFHNNDKRKYFSHKIAGGKAGKKLKNT